jgi:hypothetical protein
MDQFPPNSRKAAAGQEPKRVQRVTSDAVRRRRPLGKQFKHTFFGGDANTAVQYMIFNVLIPAAKDAMVEAASSGFEKLVFGDARPRRGPMSNPLGQISYHRMSQQQPQSQRQSSMPQALSRAGRARFAFDEIVIPSRQEAEEVLDRLFDLISKYDTATVADLYELTGLASSHIDHKWGWSALRGASVSRVRGGGYLLNLPQPESLG